MKECLHKPLSIDCDRYCLVWNAVETYKQDIRWEQSELDILNAIQAELEAGIVEI
jgi:hypothetical protein